MTSSQSRVQGIVFGIIASIALLTVVNSRCPAQAQPLQLYSEAKSNLYKKHFADGSAKQDGTTGGRDPRNADIVICWDRSGNPDGWGDSAWRTGLAAIATILEGDDASTLRFLQALSDRCWDGDQPLRHPSYEAWKRHELHENGSSDLEIAVELRKDYYSQDAFIPQLAACYLAVKRSKDPAVRKTAMDLLRKFSQTLAKNEFRFGPRSDFATPPGCVYVFYHVLNDLGMRPGWTPLILPYYLKNKTDEGIRELLAYARGHAVDVLRVELDKVSIMGHEIPNDIKNTVVDAFRKAMEGVTTLDNFRVEAQRRLDEVQKILPCNLVLDVVGIAALMVLDESQLIAMAFNLDAKSWIHKVRDAGDSVKDYYSLHLLFWELLLLSECGKCDDSLRRIARDLDDACAKHNMLLFSWLVGSRDRVASALGNWNPGWNNVAYMWIADIGEQNDNRSKNEQAVLYPRIDYMILYQLFAYRADGVF